MAIQNTYKVTANGQTIEVLWTVKNKTVNRTATNVVSLFTLPAAGLSYVSEVHTVGTFNALLQKWTINSLGAQQEKTLLVTYKVDDITKAGFTIVQDVTITEPEDILENNHRVVYLIREGEIPCDPGAFTTPVVEISDDSSYERIYISDNDSIICPCCEVEFTSSNVINVVVHGFTKDVDGRFYASITRIDPKQDSFFDYTAICKNCTDHNEYPAGVNATVQIMKLFSGTEKVYKALMSQTGADAPTVVVGKNELSGAIVWTRDSIGYYIGTLAAAFPAAKTFVQVTLGKTSSGAFIVHGARETNNTIGLRAYDEAGALADIESDIAASVLIEVWV